MIEKSKKYQFFKAKLNIFCCSKIMEELQQQQPQPPIKIDMLNKYGTDLTKLAQENKLDPVIGRHQQIERVMQILCKRGRNNPCLIGDPGVGKTVIAEGLSQLISNSKVPLKLQGKKVFSMDMGRLVAGTSYSDEFVERLINVVDEVKQSNGIIILFIDELHTLIALDAGNILKPALACGELRCIGATTLDKYRKYIEKDPALKRRFQVVEVPELSVDAAIEILKGLCKPYETHHNVKYTDNALVAAARLSNQYISDLFLPDKAIDLIDEAGSRVQLYQTQSSTSTPFVNETDIEKIVSSWTGIPVEKLSAEESQKLLKMEEKLHKHIIGQDEAVKAISQAIRRARVGIRDTSRPIGSFLFTGPTGVGKTELANALAAEYFGSREAMIRIDMSEYMEKHTVSKFIGSPPGYIDYDEGGQLTESVRQRPNSVILFDEIEKAHRNVLNVMLQIMDDGQLTDSQGRTVDFKNTIIIMTSNIGQDLIKPGVSFDKVKFEIGEEVKKSFKPEFLNRVDEVVIFLQLTKSQLKEIVNIMLKQVQERLLQKKNITLEVTEKLKDKIIEEGFNPSYGARPLRRAIVRVLEDSLAEKILSGDITEGKSATFDVDDDGKLMIFYDFLYQDIALVSCASP